MQPFQCDLQPQLQAKHRTTQTGTTWNNHSLQNTEEEPIASGTTAVATAAHTRYFSSPAAATLHRKLQGFVLRLPPHPPCNINATFPSYHFPSSPPFIKVSFFWWCIVNVLLCSAKSHTTLHQGQFFCDVLLCSVKSHTTLHQGQVSIAHHPSS